MKSFAKTQLIAMTTDEVIEADVEFRDEIAATTCQVELNNLHQHRTSVRAELYIRAWDGDLAAKRYYWEESI